MKFLFEINMIMSVSTFFPISEFSYFIIRFLNQIFLSFTLQILFSDFTIK